MGKYICKKCGHASGYHKEIRKVDSRSFHECHIIDCGCKCFEWDEKDLERANDIKYQGMEVIKSLN